MCVPNLRNKNPWQWAGFVCVSTQSEVRKLRTTQSGVRKSRTKHPVVIPTDKKATKGEGCWVVELLFLHPMFPSKPFDYLEGLDAFTFFF